MAVTVILVLLVAAFLAGVSPVSGDALVEDYWETVAPLSKPYSYGISGATVLDGKIYFIGEGICECYDPDANAWTAVTPPPLYTGGAVAACQNKIYLTGAPTQVYDSATGLWSSAAALPESRWAISLVNVNGTLYAVEGRNASFVTTYANTPATEKYIPAGYDANPSPTPPPSDGFTANLFLIIAVIVLVVTVAVAGLAVYHQKSKKT